MEQTASCIKFDFNRDDEREAKLMPLCMAILSQFSFSSERIYVYVARTEEPDFTDSRSPTIQGKFFRGIQFPPEDFYRLPPHMLKCLYRPITEFPNDDVSLEEQRAYDNFIYIRNSICVDPVGFVLTLAHELQHVTQRYESSKILSANSLLFHNLAKTIDRQTTLTPIDIPHEQDANVVSKRVAETIFGPELVRKFAETQINMFEDMSRYGDRDAHCELVRWRFFLCYDSSVPYDLKARTIPFFEQFRTKIKPALAKKYGLDIHKEQWWA
jgi:hypothetical protein